MNRRNIFRLAICAVAASAMEVFGLKEVMAPEVPKLVSVDLEAFAAEKGFEICRIFSPKKEPGFALFPIKDLGGGRMWHSCYPASPWLETREDVLMHLIFNVEEDATPI